MTQPTILPTLFSLDVNNFELLQFIAQRIS